MEFSWPKLITNPHFFWHYFSNQNLLDRIPSGRMNSHCKHHPEICAGSLHVICAGIESICVVKTVYSFGTKICDNAIHQENIQMAVGLFILYILSLSSKVVLFGFHDESSDAAWWVTLVLKALWGQRTQPGRHYRSSLMSKFTLSVKANTFPNVFSSILTSFSEISLTSFILLSYGNILCFCLNISS